MVGGATLSCDVFCGGLMTHIVMQAVLIKLAERHNMPNCAANLSLTLTNFNALG